MVFVDPNNPPPLVLVPKPEKKKLVHMECDVNLNGFLHLDLN